MGTPTGTDPFHAPVPPGWPSEDDTVPDEVEALGGGSRRPRAPDARPGSERNGRAPAEGAGVPRPVRRRSDPAEPDRTVPPRGSRRRTDPDPLLVAAGLVPDPEASPERREDGGARPRPGHGDNGDRSLPGPAGGPPTARRAPDTDRPDDPAGRAGGERPSRRAPLVARTLVSDALHATAGLASGLAHPTGRPPADPPPDAEELDVDDDLIAGSQPAGRVLVVMVATLLLAMLVNADALVERAEARAPGPARERSLAVWHPVQDVSHALQLHRVRQLADWVAGDDETEPGPPESPRDSRRAPGSATDDRQDDDRTPAEDRTADGPPGEPTLRTPTEDDPLRLWVGGDFTAQLLGEALMSASESTGVVDPVLHYESASGLTRTDYYDWPRALTEDVADHDAEVVVVALGANDAQGIVLPEGDAAQLDDPRWVAEYRRRVGDLMDQLRADDRLTVWVGQPPMRDPDYAGRMAMLNQAYAEEAASRPWVSFVDPATVVGDPSGAYTDTVPGADGAPVEVRQPDGIHLTPAGADLLAAHVLALVDEQADLPDQAGDPAPG